MIHECTASEVSGQLCILIVKSTSGLWKAAGQNTGCQSIGETFVVRPWKARRHGQIQKKVGRRGSALSQRKTFRGIVGNGTRGSKRLRVLCQHGDSVARAFSSWPVKCTSREEPDATSNLRYINKPTHSYLSKKICKHVFFFSDDKNIFG